MKIYFLITVLFSFFINCYDVKEDISLLKTPNASLLLNYVLYPKNNSNIVFLSSQSLPGTTIYVKKIGATYYALIEDSNNINLLKLFISLNGLDFEDTNHIIDSTNFTPNGKRFLFSKNNEIIYTYINNLINNNNYNYYSYINGNWNLNNFSPIQGVGQYHILDCLYIYNNELRGVISVNDPATFTYTGNIYSITNSFQTFTNLSSSPGYTTPRSSVNCSVVESTVYLYGGFRTNCSSGNCNYIDLYSSQNGTNFSKINSDFQTNLMGNDRIIKVGENTLLALPYFFNGYLSNDSGNSWSSISFSIGTTVSNPNLVGLASSGDRVFIYSVNKVYYGSVR